MKNTPYLYICTVFCCLMLSSCGDSKFAQWGNKKLNELYYKNERSLDDTEYKMRKYEKTEKARKRMEKEQERNVPEGIKKYIE